MMTVHGQRSSSPDSNLSSGNSSPSTHIPSHGFLTQMSPYVHSNMNMNRSWNGFIFHVSSIPNGKPTNGHKFDLSRSYSEPDKYANLNGSGSWGSTPFIRSSSTRCPLQEDDSSSYSRSSDMTEDEEYVTLDNNYVFSARYGASPPVYSRPATALDFKRNQFNSSIRSDQVRYINNHISSGDLREEPNLNNISRGDRSKSLKSLRRFAGNIGAALTPRSSTKQVREESKPKGGEPKRSKSVGDLRLFGPEHENETDDMNSSICYSDDDDGDEFGFLSSSSLSLVMSKSKSSAHTQNILAKKLRSKTRPLPDAATCTWSPQGNCVWSSVSGRKVSIRPTTLLQLTEQERLALQKIALAKLQAMGLSCQVHVPKENSDTRKSKRPTLSFSKYKRSKSANLSSLIDRVHENKDGDNKETSGLVFGIPLAKCIANDNQLQKQRSSTSLANKQDDVIIHRRTPRKSSCSSHSSNDNLDGNSPNLSPSNNNNTRLRVPSSESITESDGSRNTNNSSLLDALSLSTSRHGSLRPEHLPLYASGTPQVPQIVKTCFKHLENYGLRVLGIFRVGCSKKRVKQLREEFDSGNDVQLNESHNPHDVGALLKEYFRDLPEPLLTRDLYTPFVATRQLPREDLVTSLQHLVSLLPVPNRDTLYALLNFLAVVDANSTDLQGQNGDTLAGNKMNSYNLATLFGPNVLHMCKGTEKEYTVESLDRAEERKEVIEVIKEMIDNHHKLFEVSAELHDAVLRAVLKTDPEMADNILKRIAAESSDQDPDTTSSSLYEDSDSASLPHSPSSETDASSSKRMSGLHPPLRNSQSDEAVTPRTRRKFFFSSNSDKNKIQKDIEQTEKGDKPRFRLRLDRSPSPNVRSTQSQRSPRPPKVKVSDTSSSPAVLLRRHRSDYTERPRSENYGSHNLAIPKPHYARQHSSSNVTSSQTSPCLSCHGESEQEQWLLPTPPSSGSNSPRAARKVTSSQARPLGVVGNVYVPSSPHQSLSEVEREKWRQWEIMAAENADDSYEKETLV